MDTLGGTVGCHEQYPNPSVLDVAISFTDFPLNDTIGGSSIPVSNGPIHEGAVDTSEILIWKEMLYLRIVLKSWEGLMLVLMALRPIHSFGRTEPTAEDLVAYAGIYHSAIDANGMYHFRHI